MVDFSKLLKKNADGSIQLTPDSAPSNSNPSSQPAQKPADDQADREVDFIAVVTRRLYGPGNKNFYILKVLIKTKVGIVKGNFASITEGMTYRFIGVSKYDPIKQERFVQCQKYEEIRDATPFGIIRYLSTECNTVGDAMAERLVGKYGLQTLDIICDPSRTAQEIDGLTLERATLIANWAQSEKTNLETKKKLYAIGLTPHQMKKVMDTYGQNAEEKMRRDCFKLGEIPGFGWQTVSKIADLLGIPHADPGRVKAGIVHCFEGFFEEGDVCVQRSKLIREACDLLDVSQQVLVEQLDKLIEYGKIVDSGNPPPHASLETILKQLTPGGTTV